MIYHIVPQSDWLAQADAPAYEAASLHTEGFIHCSTADQVAGVLSRYYQNVPDLQLLHIDPTRLTADLRYEPIPTGELYPHIYGPINREAVVQIAEIL